MNSLKINQGNFYYFLTFLVVTSCTPTREVEPIPLAFFDPITRDLTNLPAMNQDGGYLEITDRNAGVRGIILYRHNQNTYYAYEKNCSYRPNQACATVNVHSSQLFMYDACCGSTFQFPEGLPTSGPAWTPLRQYHLVYDNGVITITDEVL